MGVACARVLGRRYRLILAEVSGDNLAATSAILRRDGTEIVAEVVGDIAAESTIASITATVEENGGIDGLVHTAGISPSMGTWDRVLAVNLSATLSLLDAVEPHLKPGSAGVLIASLAAQTFRGTGEIDALLKTVTAANAAQMLEELVCAIATGEDALQLSVAAYGISKYAVTRLCEDRALQWGARGARLVSVSPGLIATPMGLMEASGNPAAAGLAEQAPVGRWGTAIDIADAVEFLLSDAASFISGCDLRVDGGLAPVLNSYS
jgi:NAD(P)-dependent dehydrogenase (short-subunit alcohol dehydrogenase family)